MKQFMDPENWSFTTLTLPQMSIDFSEAAKRQAVPLPALERTDLSGITAVVTGANTGMNPFLPWPMEMRLNFV